MANCHKLFLQFNDDISLPSSKRKSLKDSKDGLRKRIKLYFSKNHHDYFPKFYIQGSYKCSNNIIYEDNTCDLDDGVYFLRKPDVEPTTLQKWILNAVDGYTTTKPKHLKKCIRVIFKDDYHIDIPVFYKTDDDGHPFIAIKNTGWGDDDPKEFVDWLVNAKDDEGQLVRLTKYLKDWCKGKSHKMPNGLCMTVLVEKNIKYNERDDIALKNTLKKIESSLSNHWICKMPTHPFENLFSDYSDILKRNFLHSIEKFIEDAEEAISEKSEYKASQKWQKHLTRFSLGEKTEEEEKVAALLTAAFAIKSKNHYTTSDGNITLEKTAIKNKAHRFYGE